MAPTVLGQLNYPKEHQASSHKLRKPLVEKLRRDRINTSIEQLKSLLGPEFLRQHPDSKQEKADILEMAVYFLRHWQQQRAVIPALTATNDGYSQPAHTANKGYSNSPLTATSDGYSHCVQEALSFLSQQGGVKNQSEGKLLSHFQSIHSTNAGQSPPPPPLSPPTATAIKGANPVSSALWRPW